MVTYSVLLIACLISAPAQCQTHEIILQASPIPTTAFVEAQAKAGAWLALHPGLTIKGLTLRPGRDV